MSYVIQQELLAPGETSRLDLDSKLKNLENIVVTLHGERFNGILPPNGRQPSGYLNLYATWKFDFQRTLSDEAACTKNETKTSL